MNENLDNLKKRILYIAYKNKLSHLGSYLSSVAIIDDIFLKMKNDDIFILSSGHASLALYVCLEKYKNIDAEFLFEKHGGHPHRDEENFIYCSTGSLGLGITVALGRAVANPNRKVHVLISDGECAEGSVWEALSFAQINKLTNLNKLCEGLPIQMQSYIQACRNLNFDEKPDYNKLKQYFIDAAENIVFTNSP